VVELRDLRVLLVDDNETQHRLVPLVLARVGITHVRSEAGARSVPDAVDAFDPDVILLDMHLADGDAFDVLAALAVGDPHWNRRHVVLVTGDIDPRTSKRARELGARGVLHKPFGIAELTDVVTRAAATWEPTEPTDG